MVMKTAFGKVCSVRGKQHLRSLVSHKGRLHNLYTVTVLREVILATGITNLESVLYK